MVKKYTADNLIEYVRDIAMVPDSSSVGTDDTSILEHLNHALLTEITPQVAKVKEEYFVVTERVPIGSSQSKYRINHRAMGGRIRDIVYLNGTSEYSQLDMVNRNELPYWGADGNNQPEAFYLEGNYIVLLPTISGGTGSLEISFPFRPGELVLVENTRTVAAVVSSTEVTLSSAVPSGWTTSSSKYDIHSGESGAEISSWDLTATTVSGAQMIFSEAIDGSVFGTHPVAVGDYVCVAEEAALPALPRELHPVLGQAAACRVLLALGDDENLKIQVSKLERMIKDSQYLLESRVEGKPHIISNRNSLFRTSRGARQRADSFSLN